MLLLQGILVSEELVTEHFVCNLQACRGACCWEGAYGAPLEPAEMETIQAILPSIEPLLSDAGREALKQWGPFTWFAEAGFWGTSLVDGGPCMFMTKNEQGIAECAFEKAWAAGDTGFQKPVSCHLYPVRVKVNEEVGFHALNYDRWDICAAACVLGASVKMPVYQFVKSAIVRKYGQEFYDELEAAGDSYKNSQGKGSG
jgi:hypothetical protein